jgi:hypothetical protein
MYAEVGDKLVREGERTEFGEQLGVVVEVRGNAGRPPYLVRSPDGRESVMFPDPGVFVMKGNHIEV